MFASLACAANVLRPYSEAMMRCPRRAPCDRALIAREVQMRQLDALRPTKWATFTR